MTLKEETKMALDLLLEGKRDREDYELDEDKRVHICMREEQNNDCIAECCGGCEDCEIDERGKCKYEIVEKFDLVLSNYSEWKFFYIDFNRKGKHYSNFYTINNHKRLYDVVIKIKNDVFSYEKFCVDMHVKMDELDTYAVEFANKVCEEIFFTKNQFNKNSLLIKYDSTDKDYDYKKVVENGFKTDINKLKINLRHELIHFLLNLYKLNYNDNSAMFWIVAEKYDAGPYEELSGKKQNYMTNFMK